MLEMDVLVEVHNQARTGPRAGIADAPRSAMNNRDLKTLQTDLQTTEDLAPFVPPDRLLITESGIRTREDVRRLGEVGAQCLLVGESLLRQPDVEVAIHDLLGTRAT